MAVITTAVVPIDLLDATNQLLTAIGQGPITSLTTAAARADATKAQQELSRTAVEVQQRGWHFNTETCWPITPDVTGALVVPSNCLRIVTDGDSACRYDLVQRGPVMYDRKAHSSVLFPQGVAVTFTMVVALTFENLPAAARWYITCLAGRRFVDKEAVSPAAHQFSDEEVRNALVQLEVADALTRDVTMAQVSPHVQFMRRR